MELQSILNTTPRDELLKWFAIGAGLTVAGACVGAIVVVSNKNKRKDNLALGVT